MRAEGQIVTFYSYKGGTGRSMALANVGVLLARWGYKVLLVDWDLEAPGLECFFVPFLTDSETLVAGNGVIDLLNTPAGRSTDGGATKDWREMVLDIHMADGSSVHLLSAGRRTPDYFRRVTSLSVERLYSADGGQIIEALRDQWKSEYDFVLVDSRTGVTDIGGICTIQLPDQLVLLFTPSDQALEGVLAVCASVRNAHEQLTVDRQRLSLLPVLSRLDVQQEFVLLQEWTRKSAERLRDVYQGWLPSSVAPERMLDATKLPYRPFFSFGERLAVIDEGTTDSTGLGYAYENLAALIANRLESARSLLEDRDYFVRLASKRKGAATRQQPTVLLCHCHQDKLWADRIATHLSVFAQQGNLETWDDQQIRVGSNWLSALEDAVRRARVFLVLVSAEFLASRFMVEQELLLLSERRMKEGIHIVPILVSPCAWQQHPFFGSSQVRPMGGQPLSVLSKNKADVVLAKLATTIVKLATTAVTHTAPTSPKERELEALRKEYETRLRMVEGERDRLHQVIGRVLAAPQTIKMVTGGVIVDGDAMPTLRIQESIQHISDLQKAVLASPDEALPQAVKRRALDIIGSALKDVASGQVNEAARTVCELGKELGPAIAQTAAYGFFKGLLGL